MIESEYMTATKNLAHRFDFDIGYLIKSPCGGCEHYVRFPGCTKTCHIIERIQTRLAASVSCSQREAS
jgi:hypothetical protein